jgi:diacylglycerol kinase (ATP)
MHTLLIVNPASGQGKAAREKRRLLELVSNMPHIHTRLTSGPDDARKFAAEAAQHGYNLVIAAGGDGTINQVINGIGDSGVTLGIIPLGTGNVLAHELDIPRNDIVKALRVIGHGRIRSIDLGEANGQRFLLMAGLGLDAHVVDAVSPVVKDVLGTAAYAPAALDQLIGYVPTDFRLTFDNGSSYSANAFGVIVANCGSYAYNFKITSEAVLDDGMLDVMVFESAPAEKLRLVGHALGAVFGQRIKDPNVTYFRTKGVSIESDPPVKMQLDGDVCGECNAEVRILPGALRLIAP